MPFLYNFSYDTHNTYRLHFFNLKDVIRGHWRLKNKVKILNEHKDAILTRFLIKYLHPLYNTLF